MPHDPVIEPTQLDEIGAFRLLDVRDPAAFEAGHPANAVRVPIELWEAAARAGETSFGNAGYWERAIGALGVDAATPTVIYDDGRATEAARVWFILQYFGADASILNGGWPAIEGRRDLNALPPAPTNFQARPASGAVGLVERERLKAELGGDVRIFDARTAAEFAGDDLRRNARGGHLPGARLLPHADLLSGGRVRSGEELRALLAEVGFRPGDHVVTHCNGGGRAALAAAAAVRAGFEDVRA